MTDAAPRVRVGLIWAQARDGVIGSGGLMPWHLPEDLAHFKQVTMDGPVIMGRRTWDSIPERFRPLPGRRNIVVTRSPAWSAEGAEAAPSVQDALSLAGCAISAALAPEDLAQRPPKWRNAGAAAPALVPPTVWVIGGGQVYASVIDAADVLEVTEIDLEVEGDTLAPAIDADTWHPASIDPAEGWHTSRTGLRYRFLTYTRA
ncbi:dihydrofolate reductase [Rathayibacter sp. YIM 133350]|uniref:dihydrofolate reductase n=1 Tax=Rathayibacter sp. YIM 133350 TaxID=3131992 RepID=UPI00307E519B